MLSQSRVTKFETLERTMRTKLRNLLMPKGHWLLHFRLQTLASWPVLPISPRSNLEKVRCVAGHASDDRCKTTNITSQCDTEFHEIAANGGAYSLAMHCLSCDHRVFFGFSAQTNGTVSMPHCFPKLPLWLKIS